MIPKCILRPTCIFGKYMQNDTPVMLSAIWYPHNSLEQIRHKHWDPRFKKLRREKVLKIDLPNYEETDKEKQKEERRSIMKNQGILPQKQWIDTPIFISCTNEAFDRYIPPEGDGVFSTMSKQGMKQKMSDMQMKGKSMMAIRKIKSYDLEFSLAEFPQQALDIYIKAHEALAAKDTETMRRYVTEVAYGRMLHKTTNKIIRWKFGESLEMPRVVHARTEKLEMPDHIFGQVTVRFHSQQILSIYDRFGRLLMGSEILKKDVLEYIVFEKFLSAEYGRWRLHLKIIPPWMSPTSVGEPTYVLPRKENAELSDTPIESPITKDAVKEVAN